MQSQSNSLPERRPPGFDRGLQCLAGVFVWTMAVKFFLPAATHTHNKTLLLFAMLGDFVGMVLLFLVSMIVWLRRKEAIHPPRNWALVLAIIWSFASSTAWAWTFAAANRHEESGANSNSSSSLQSGGMEIDRKNFSVSLPEKWTENTKDNMYNAESFIFFEGPESTIFSVTIGQKSAGASLDQTVNKQRDVFSKKFTDTTITQITNWSTYDGKGFEIEGKIQGIVNARMTIFGFENGDNVCIVEEYATLGDYQKYITDFDQIRQSFKLN